MGRRQLGAFLRQQTLAGQGLAPGELQAEFLETDSVLAAFAMRALGTLRDDPAFLESAASRFEALGFEAQAATTRAAASTRTPRD